MPDQLPSAILDSSNSADSLFALDLDTKQRFDNILSGVQKPIDYPIPDFNKDMYPNGLPQNDLLDPSKMKGTLGEALFSPDQKLASLATDKIRNDQSQLPVNRGIGVPDRFHYDKMMNKYLNGDFGYNPYQSIEDNEDFNYRYDYLNQSAFAKVIKNTGVGIGRFLGGAVMKLGQNLGYVGSMIGNGIQELVELGGGPHNNFMADVADNSMSRWFENQEQSMKDSNLLSVFKPKDWSDKGFFSKLTNGAFWTDEIADGAAFMGEMVASMYLLGGLGKVGSIGRLGEVPINMASKLGKAGKVLDALTKFSTGADNVAGIGRWAFSVTSEAAMEAADGYDTVTKTLKDQRNAGLNTYSDEEIRQISGDRAAARFKANMLILSASNAFENRFIFGPLFKKGGIQEVSGGERGSTLRKLIGISDDASSLETLAQASRKEYKYSTWLGKKLDWKNANSRLRFYGGRGLSSIAAEGFWEENAQLVAERLSATDNLSPSTFIHKLGTQTWDAITGKDPEAADNIGLGGLIGIGGTSIVSKVRGGNRWFQGERQQTEEDALSAINTYEEYRKKFLNFNDIHITDPKTGKPILDEDGNMQIDDVKAAGLMEGLTKFNSKQAAIIKMSNPLLRKAMQDDALGDFIIAAKSAGIFNRSLDKFKNIQMLDAEQLKKLGFDPNTVTDAAYLVDSMENMGKLYDKSFSMTAKMTKSDTKEDEQNRKFNHFKAASREFSYNKIADEYRRAMNDVNYPSVYSPEAEDQDTLLQEYNASVFQRMGHSQFAAHAEENGDFYKDFIKQHDEDITRRQSNYLATLEPKINSQKLVPTYEGFLMSKERYQRLFGRPFKFEHFSPRVTNNTNTNKELDIIGDESRVGELPDMMSKVAQNEHVTLDKLGYSRYFFEKQKISERQQNEARVLYDMENENQAKYAETQNTAAQMKYLKDKMGHPISGIEGYKSYKKYTDSIQEKDAAADKEATDATNPNEAPKVPPATPPAAPSAPVAPAVVVDPAARPATSTVKVEPLTSKEVVKSQNILGDLVSVFSEVFSQYTSDNNTLVIDYQALVSLVNDNYADKAKEITAFFSTKVDELTKPLLDKINNATLSSNDNDNVNQLTNLEGFVSELSAQGMNKELSKVLEDRISSTLDAVEGYDFENPQPVEDIIQSARDFSDAMDTIAYYLKEDKITDDIISKFLDSYSEDNSDSSLPDKVLDMLNQIRTEGKYNLGDNKLIESFGNFLKGEFAVEEVKKTVQSEQSKVEPVKVEQPIIEEQKSKTGVDISNSNNNENKNPILPPPPPPVNPPVVVENSDSEDFISENYLDTSIDTAKINGVFSLVQNFPEEAITDRKGVVKIVNGAIQMKTTEGPQQEQLLRQHNVLKKMGSVANSINFWSEDTEGNRLFRIKLLFAGPKNEVKYEKWVYRTDLGKTDSKGNPYKFPFIIAVITDQKGNPVYFTKDGDITGKTEGIPVAFPYSIEEYKSDNLNTSRKGIMTRSREVLNGTHGYENDDPMADVSKAIIAGLPVYGDIDNVTSGKLSGYTTSNSPSNTMKPSYTMRTVQQMIDAGDISNDTPFILKQGNLFEYTTNDKGEQQQQVRVGQPFLYDRKSTLYIPLRGKKISELTIKGKPLIDGVTKIALDELEKDGETSIPEDASSEVYEKFDSLFQFLRALFYSGDIAIIKSSNGNKIYVQDNRPIHSPLLNTEVNFSSNIEVMQKPFTTEEFSYRDFIAENFMSGAVPVEMESGKKSFEKLNKRINFTLEYNHKQLLAASESIKPNTKTVRVSPDNTAKFVGKTYSKKGSTGNMTVTGFKDGNFTIQGEDGKQTTQSKESFMKDLTTMQEVTLPTETPEIKEEFEKRIKLSKDKIKELNDKSKTSTEDDFKDDDFGC